VNQETPELLAALGQLVQQALQVQLARKVFKDHKVLLAQLGLLAHKG
jgi:hypothetical protein